MGLNLTVPPNTKVLLVGANGTGKSTLIYMLTDQILTGMDYDELSINGTSKPNDHHNGIMYLRSAWKRQQTAFEGMCPYTVDYAASQMFEKWQSQYVDRRDELVKILGIDKIKCVHTETGESNHWHFFVRLLNNSNNNNTKEVECNTDNHWMKLLKNEGGGCRYIGR